MSKTLEQAVGDFLGLLDSINSLPEKKAAWKYIIGDLRAAYEERIEKKPCPCHEFIDAP